MKSENSDLAKRLALFVAALVNIVVVVRAAYYQDQIDWSAVSVFGIGTLVSVYFLISMEFQRQRDAK